MQRLAPALIASALLHLAVLVLALMHWPFLDAPAIQLSATPVEIVSSVPRTAAPPAPAPEPAPQPQPAPEPAPAPPPKPEPKPEPQPAPAPIPPPVAAKTAPKPAQKPAQKPAKTAPKKPDDSLDYSALASSLSKSSAASKSAKSAAQTTASTLASRGATPGAAAGKSAGLSIDSIKRRLIQLWTPNCIAPGADQISFTVRFVLDASGALVGQTQLKLPSGELIRESEYARRIDLQKNIVQDADIRSAFNALRRGSPFADVPPDVANRPIEILFDARTACTR